MLLKRLGAFFLDILEVIVFAVGIFFFVYLLILRPHKIKGASMHPNYPDGYYLLTQRVSYYLDNPERGDVVVFKPPVSDDEFIKRVVALPGEKISVINGKVYINDKLLNEPYLDASVVTYGGSFLKEGEEETVPEGNFVVLGDNRPHSSDSRVWGYITKDKITGKAWLIYWPIGSFGLPNKVHYEF